MPTRKNSAPIHGTTVLCVRRDNKVVITADGQVTMGEHVMKHTARKTRRLFSDKILAGFAGSTADALSLFERFEGKLQEHQGNLAKSAVELAKEWRKDRALRHLEALLIVADTKSTFLVSGNGDVIEPDDGICAIGSGGPYALAAARALAKHTKLSAKDVAQEAMRIASEICIFTNANFTVEELERPPSGGHVFESRVPRQGRGATIAPQVRAPMERRYPAILHCTKAERNHG